MAVITKLEASKKIKSRVNLYLDSRFALSLSLDLVASKNLAVGKELSKEELAELEQAKDREQIYWKILNFLSFRPRSTQEVLRRLTEYTGRRNHTRIINKLQNDGYLDDARFAKWFVASRARTRPRSNLHLLAELQRLGVDRQTAQAAIKNENSEKNALTKLIDKFANKQRPQLTQLLLRRGFPYSLVKEALDKKERGE